MEKQQIGLIGLAVMGKKLALNIESRGLSVSVYNRTTYKTKDFLNGEAAGRKVVGTFSIQEFVRSLERPRKIILMVKAGISTGLVIESLEPYLDTGDILIDGGSTFFWAP